MRLRPEAHKLKPVVEVAEELRSDTGTDAIGSSLKNTIQRGHDVTEKKIKQVPSSGSRELLLVRS